MAIDDLTDDAFLQAYQKYPEIRELVDGIQKKYNVHISQKDKPGYNEDNIPLAAKEAKQTVIKLLSQQKQAAASESAPYSSTQFATGLLGIITTIAAFATGFYPIGVISAAVTGATLLSQYQNQTYKEKTA